MWEHCHTEIVACDMLEESDLSRKHFCLEFWNGFRYSWWGGCDTRLPCLSVCQLHILAFKHDSQYNINERHWAIGGHWSFLPFARNFSIHLVKYSEIKCMSSEVCWRYMIHCTVLAHSTVTSTGTWCCCTDLH